VITELLSLFRSITFTSLVIGWILAVAVSATVYLSVPRRGRRDPAPSVSRALVLWGSPAVAIVVATGIIAVISAPNNWDSMTYHLSRVMHWIQNESVEHYPTHILRQIELNPWAEFAILHLQVLLGSDHFSNSVQWFSMLGSVIGVTLISQQLGGSPRAQV